jgi:copper chaperone NosL
VRRRRFLAHLAAWGAALALPRAWADPRPIDDRIDVCPYCTMKVIDARFAAQVETAGGRTLTYDAIECLLDHAAGHGPPPPDVADAWLADRVASARDDATWLAVDAAVLLHHPRLRTPMGGGLAAFPDADAAAAFADANRLDDARTLTWDAARSEANDRPWVPPW